MRTWRSGVVLAAAATFAAGGPVWAHPGHLTHGDAWSTLQHLVGSPDHLAVLVALAVLGVAVGFALRSAPGARREVRAEDPPA